MKSCLVLIIVLLTINQLSVAQIVKSDSVEAVYTRVLTKRSKKIVDQLHLNDPSKADTITQILVRQYKNIGKVYDLEKAEEKLLGEARLSKDAASLQSTFINLASQVELEKLHRAFVGGLGARLSSEQVNEIKDGMTYNVLSVTYKSYLDEIPNLTPEQKTTIMADLIEAREYAMDGGSSKEKHGWFNKYKGRINNYLSKEGYNLDQERKEWAERRGAEK